MKRRLIFEICANCGDKIQDDEEEVLVDDDNDLIFCNDGCVHEYFEPQIDHLVAEYNGLRKPNDIPLSEFKKFESYMQLVLSEPDEVWLREDDENQEMV